MKKATKVDKQIQILQKRGMIIDDENKAKEILLDVGYYRLGFYWFPFENSYPEKGKKRSHDFKKGTRFNDAVDLYYFDHDFRKILLPFLCRIEVNLRTFVIYYISNYYKDNPLWFIDANNVEEDFISYFKTKYDTDIKKNDAIKHHHKKYRQDKFAPAWKTLEYATFGDIIRLCQNLKENNLQNQIAKHYEIRNVKVFDNYFGTIRLLRNMCAHGHVIFDLKLQKSIKRGIIYDLQDSDYHNIIGTVKVLCYLLSQISNNREKELKKNLCKLLEDNKEKKFFEILDYLTAL